jgi:hypothetical protein
MSNEDSKRGSGNSSTVTINLGSNNRHSSSHPPAREAAVFDLEGITQSHLRPFCLPLVVIFALVVVQVVLAIIILATVLNHTNSDLSSSTTAIASALWGSSSNTPTPTPSAQ